MQNKISVKPNTVRLTRLLDDIKAGEIKIPIFQRDFVWENSNMIELFDSIAKGFPIGSLLFWKPEETYETMKKIGPYEINAISSNLSYVLDGYQRITTLFGVLSNPKADNIDENSKAYSDFLIYYDLLEKEFLYLKRKKDKKVYIVPLYKIVDTYQFIDVLKDIEKEIQDVSKRNTIIENAKQLSKVLYEYEIPYVEIKGGDIKSAVDIFSRINSTGLPISEDFMLSALTYNRATGFKFSDKITEFLNTLNKYNFQELKRDTILNCISNATGRIYFDVSIEDLTNEHKNINLESLTNNAFIHITRAVEFLYKNMLVLDSHLLPYPTQLIFISEFFRLNPKPDSGRLQKLADWFWITSYSNYFTIYSLSQQRYAYSRFADFAMGLHSNGIYTPTEDYRFSIAKFPDKLNLQGVRTKTLQLFLLNEAAKNYNIQEKESIKELFINNKSGRTPSNTILRLSSEFEKSSSFRDTTQLIEKETPSVLMKYFINSDMIKLYKNARIDEFLTKRHKLIKDLELRFVFDLGILGNISNIADEFNFAENYSYDRVNDLLSVAEWNDYKNEVTIHEIPTGVPSYTFKSLRSLKEFLIEQADDAAEANFPSNDDDRLTYQNLYNGGKLVDKVLKEYTKQLKTMGWI